MNFLLLLIAVLIYFVLAISLAVAIGKVARMNNRRPY